MNSSWKIERLSNVVNYRKEFIIIDELENYKLCRVQTKVKGVVLREEKIGFEIKTKKQQICKTGDLIFAEMDARFGGYGIIPAELDQAIVSSHYFLYEINNEMIKMDFLQYCLHQPSFFQQVSARGSTNYAAIRPDQVLNYKIPLPPLEEQKRMILKLKTVEDNIKKIKEFIKIQEREINHFRESYFEDLQKQFSGEALSKLLIPKKEKVDIIPGQEYQQVTVKMYHKGIKLRQVILGDQIGSKQFLANAGDFILSKIDARNGAMGLIPNELDNSIVTNDFPLFSFSKDINSKYFDYFSNTQFFNIACKNASEGSTNRRRIKMNKFKQIQIPLPPLEEQNKIVDIFEKLNEVKRKHKITLKELEELFSSLLDKAFKGEV